MPAGDVLQFTVLKKQPRSEEALLLLRQIASLVKPIMKKHGWILPLLSEFFPKEVGLLGVNVHRGAKICIRLRPAHDPHSFLPLEESLIGTMLHELTHNVQGPHDAVFYKQLDELQDEYDALRASGYSGEGFLGNGTRVGVGVGHDTGVSMKEARKIALTKLEKRMKLQRLLGTGGRLGGATPDMKGKRRGDILADAAERRMRDAKTCGGGDSHDHPSGSAREDLSPAILAEIEESERDSQTFSQDGVEQAVASGSGAHANPVSENGKGKNRAAPPSRRSPRRPKKPSTKSDDTDSSIEILVPAKRPPSNSSLPAPKHPRPSSSSRQPKPASSRNPKPARLLPKPAIGWACPTCTFENESNLSLACEACYTERPESITAVLAEAESTSAGFSGSGSHAGGSGRGGTVELEEGWWCEGCGTVTPHSFWMCGGCGAIKKSSTRG